MPNSNNERKHFGKTKDGVILPIAPLKKDMDKSYFDFINDIKQRIATERVKVVMSANSSMICLYWEIGKAISTKQKELGWGAKVIDRMSADLKEQFPEMSGFSPRNIKYMKKFAEIWDDFQIVQQVVAQIPWRSNIVIMDALKNNEKRIWYIKSAIKNGWSSNVLDLQIKSKLYERQGKAINNFTKVLPANDSDMATQTFKDPYLFDFLGTDKPRRELEIEKELTTHIQKFLLELGQGFAFVGRQMHLEVGNQDYYIDLLFYHLKLRCYIVIELKACDFKPEFIGQLNMYQNVVDDVLKTDNDNNNNTIGLLLVKSKNRTVVEYSLEGFDNPIGVAEWTEKIEKDLSYEIKSSLPSIEEIERELDSID